MHQVSSSRTSPTPENKGIYNIVSTRIATSQHFHLICTKSCTRVMSKMVTLHPDSQQETIFIHSVKDTKKTQVACVNQSRLLGELRTPCLGTLAILVETVYTCSSG